MNFVFVHPFIHFLLLVLFPGCINSFNLIIKNCCYILISTEKVIGWVIVLIPLCFPSFSDAVVAVAMEKIANWSVVLARLLNSPHVWLPFAPILFSQIVPG